MNSQSHHIETFPYTPNADRSSPSSSSPRKPHIDGDVPPELSPLDAFALQGRLLAKQLDQSSKDGKRISRLPPLTIANSLATSSRPGYLRSKSAGRDGTAPTSDPAHFEQPNSHLRAAVEAPGNRPTSVYPRVSGIGMPDGAEQVPGLPALYKRRISTEALNAHNREQPPSSNSYRLVEESFSENEQSDRGIRPNRSFDSQRQPGPQQGYATDQDDPGIRPNRSFESSHRPRPQQSFSAYDHGDLNMRPKRSFDSQRQPIPQRGVSTESNRSRKYHSNALAPPRSPVPRQVSSIRSVPPESSDEEGTNSQVGSLNSISRKPSGSSALSVHSSPPISPFVPPPRSPSISSEYSIGGSRGPRPAAYNFSRPISRASRPSEESSSRQEFFESQGSHTADENMHTPVSMNGDEYVESSDPNAPASSYIYSRFSLPRGRKMNRNSLLQLEEHQQLQHFQQQQQQQQQPKQQHQPQASFNRQQNRDPSPLLDDGSMTKSPAFSQRPLSPPSPHQSRVVGPIPLAQDSSPRPSTQSADRPHSSAGSEAQSNKNSAPSVSSGATIKPATNRSAPTSGEITAEQHLAKGIECHERGSLKESTYHLRIAAKQNHPTAMLLYALACRHGWGMRPNQREGVQWLRKAADSASLEVADDEDLIKEGVSGDFMERKTRRAQFALSIYELGISHMNGWGIEQDKILALRCFEIAASWGDGDAMTEAGFCYAQGVGCKKDLKKAARYYRMAEGKGVSMVGNSWIYKSKYSEEGDRPGRSDKKEGGEKAPRDKSRTRTIFGRKKSMA